jgi:hypothetical protein
MIKHGRNDYPAERDQLRKGNRPWGGRLEETGELMNKNRIEGRYDG